MTDESSFSEALMLYGTYVGQTVKDDPKTDEQVRADHPLEWIPSENDPDTEIMDTLGIYVISDECVLFRGNFTDGIVCASMDEAKVRAQSDFDTRLRPSIATSMQPNVAEAAEVLLNLLATSTEDSPINRDDLSNLFHVTFAETGFVAVNAFLSALAKGTTQPIPASEQDQ